MKNIKKLFFILFMLSFCRVWAYDYPWPVDYQIKNRSLEEIHKIIQELIENNSGYQIYEFDSDSYFKNESHIGVKKNFYKLRLGVEELIPFGKVLTGGIYLSDIDIVIFFYIPYLSRAKKCCIRLTGYCSDIEDVDGQKCLKRNWKSHAFNDVEPTKQEIPIKESFEKNFMSKLDLEWEYEKPFLLDRGLSKFISLFRKRKDFSDD